MPVTVAFDHRDAMPVVALVHRASRTRGPRRRSGGLACWVTGQSGTSVTVGPWSLRLRPRLRSVPVMGRVDVAGGLEMRVSFGGFLWQAGAVYHTLHDSSGGRPASKDLRSSASSVSSSRIILSRQALFRHRPLPSNGERLSSYNYLRRNTPFLRSLVRHGHLAGIQSASSASLDLAYTL